MKDSNHRSLYRLFKLFDKFCKHRKIKYMAAYGTLLGAVRDHGIIAHDNDIDVMVFHKDYDKLSYLVDNPRGRLIFTRAICGFRVSLNDDNSACIDIYMLQCDESTGDFIQAGPYYKNKPTRIMSGLEPVVFQSNDIFPLTNRPFGKFTIPVQNNHINYLKSYYGDNCLTTVVKYGANYALHDSVMTTIADIAFLSIMDTLFDIERFKHQTKIDTSTDIYIFLHTYLKQFNSLLFESRNVDSLIKNIMTLLSSCLISWSEFKNATPPLKEQQPIAQLPANLSITDKFKFICDSINDQTDITLSSINIKQALASISAKICASYFKKYDVQLPFNFEAISLFLV